METAEKKWEKTDSKKELHFFCSSFACPRLSVHFLHDFSDIFLLLPGYSRESGHQEIKHLILTAACGIEHVSNQFLFLCGFEEFLEGKRTCIFSGFCFKGILVAGAIPVDVKPDESIWYFIQEDFHLADRLLAGNIVSRVSVSEKVPVSAILEFVSGEVVTLDKLLAFPWSIKIPGPIWELVPDAVRENLRYRVCCPHIFRNFLWIHMAEYQHLKISQLEFVIRAAPGIGAGVEDEKTQLVKQLLV